MTAPAPVLDLPAVTDLLAAVFTVNRTAKRYRDKASKHYNAGQYGLASHARNTKERMYAMKDRGITYAYRQGLLCVSGMHACLTYYEGHGYRFHSLLRPTGRDIPVLSEELIVVEAKPKGWREMRLLDATHALEQLPELDSTGFSRHHFPPRRQPRPRWREYDDWEYDHDEEELL